MQKKLMIALGIAAVAATVWAVPPERPANRPHPASFKESLGLTDDQAAKIEGLRADFKKARIQHQAAVKIAHLELAELMGAGTIDEKAVQLKVKQLGDLQAAGLKARVDHQLAVQKTLTPEQRAKLKELRHERGFQRANGHMGRPGMGRGRMMRRQRMGADAEDVPAVEAGPGWASNIE
jgi:Spy/CpxP family protein refolding chaperone